jgi:hypothetical protein
MYIRAHRTSASERSSSSPEGQQKPPEQLDEPISQDCHDCRRSCKGAGRDLHAETDIADRSRERHGAPLFLLFSARDPSDRPAAICRWAKSRRCSTTRRRAPSRACLPVLVRPDPERLMGPIAPQYRAGSGPNCQNIVHTGQAMRARSCKLVSNWSTDRRLRAPAGASRDNPMPAGRS